MVPHGGFDLVLSIGQVVPHEVIGMANYKKNMLIGTGGQEGINRSHYLGVVHGMERVMGRAKSPVRNVLNYAADHFLHDAPIVYILTVIGKHPDGRLVVRGLLTGDDIEYFHFASDLSLQSILKYSIAHYEKWWCTSVRRNFIARGWAIEPSTDSFASMDIMAPGQLSVGWSKTLIPLRTCAPQPT